MMKRNEGCVDSRGKRYHGEELVWTAGERDTMGGTWVNGSDLVYLGT